MISGTILLVDDEAELVEEFERALKRKGYTVDTANNGEEGWEKYQHGYYDVVIVDWNMDKMNGMQLLEKIDNMHPSTKVIMMTAYGDEQIAIKAHHHHAFDYLTKPLEIKVLLEKVQEAIRRKDPIIAALENWVKTYPDEASRPLMATLEKKQQIWSGKDILNEIKANTERGQQEYQKIVQLTFDLLSRGQIQ